MHADNDHSIAISKSQLRDLTEKGVTLLSSGTYLRIATEEEGRDIEGICVYLKGVGHRVMPTWEQLKAWMRVNGYKEHKPQFWGMLDPCSDCYGIEWHDDWAWQEMGTNIRRLATNEKVSVLKMYNAIMGIK